MLQFLSFLIFATVITLALIYIISKRKTIFRPAVLILFILLFVTSGLTMDAFGKTSFSKSSKISSNKIRRIEKSFQSYQLDKPVLSNLLNSIEVAKKNRPTKNTIVITKSGFGNLAVKIAKHFPSIQIIGFGSNNDAVKGFLKQGSMLPSNLKLIEYKAGSSRNFREGENVDTIDNGLSASEKRDLLCVLFCDKNEYNGFVNGVQSSRFPVFLQPTNDFKEYLVQKLGYKRGINKMYVKDATDIFKPNLHS